MTYIPGVYATRSDFAPPNLITHIKLNIDQLIEFAKQNPDLVSNDVVQFTIWADEKGLYYAVVDIKKQHPGYFDPKNYEHYGH